MSQFRNLVFEGGGVKGIAYAGAVHVLEKHKILAIPAGPTVLRMLPPLIVTQDDMDRAVDAVIEVLSA